MINQAIQTQNPQTKALGYAPSAPYSSQPKQLGGAFGTDPGLAAWYEEATVYYNAVMAGQIPQPNPQEWGQFMEWLNWAASAMGMGGGAWGDPMGGYGQAMGPQQQPLPPGAIPGAQGNAVYDQMDANINHTPYGQPIDIYSNNVVINSGSMMTTFTCEITTDTRLNPAEQVLKITASDGTVYFVHDYEDANIVIKTPVEDMVNTGGLSNVSWEEFTGGAEGSAAGGGITGGEIEKVDDTHSVITAGAGETIDAVPNKNVKETQYYTIYGEFNVSLPADCTGDITKNADGDTVVTVKDRDGKVIAEYTVKSGFPVNVNHANEKSITVNGKPLKKTEDADGNETFNGFEGLSINGVETKGSSGIIGNIGQLGGLIGQINGTANQGPSQEDWDNYGNLLAIANATGSMYGYDFCKILFDVYPQLVNYDKNFDGLLQADELTAAAKDGYKFPPDQPDGAFLNLLAKLNPELGGMIQTLKAGLNVFDSQSYAEALTKLRDKVMGILEEIYQGKAHVLPKSDNTQSIMFNGQELNVFTLLGVA